MNSYFRHRHGDDEIIITTNKDGTLVISITNRFVGEGREIIVPPNEAAKLRKYLDYKATYHV